MTALASRGASVRVLVVAATTLFLSVVLAMTAPAAHAHAELVESWPAAGPTDDPVQDVTLRFGEALADGLAQVAVTGPGGSLVDGAPQVTGAEVVVPLRPLTKAGSYRVEYRVVAVDGHTEVGGFDVDVSEASASAAASFAAPGRQRPADGPQDRVEREAHRSTPPSGVPSAAAALDGDGFDLALTGGGAAMLVLLMGVHVMVRRTPASRRTS